MLQHTATRCNILQHTATHSNTHLAILYCNFQPLDLESITLDTLQHSTLQHTATHCNITVDTCKISQQKNARRRERKWVYVVGCLQGILLDKQGS